VNRKEARDQFRSVAKTRCSASRNITLEEAKTKFIVTAADLDKKIGLDSSEEHGPGGRGFPFLVTFLSLIRAQSWILPLLSGLVHAGGKSIDMILGLLAFQSKSVRRRKRKV